jgi:inorganic pyrophosphatase
MADFAWEAWERLLQGNQIILDRPRGTSHPSYPDVVYPVDYGYVLDTPGDDGEELDVFVGSSDSGLTAVVVIHDAIKNERELKLLWNLSSEEVDAVARFVNRGAMTGEVIRRR